MGIFHDLLTCYSQMVKRTVALTLGLIYTFSLVYSKVLCSPSLNVFLDLLHPNSGLREMHRGKRNDVWMLLL